MVDFLRSRFLVFLFLFLSNFTSAENVQPFALMTIPKSGSHLIIKALHLLTGGVPIWHTHFPSVFYIPPEKGFLYTHLCLSEILEKNYRNLPKLKKIVNIRDLRDVCVSIVYQIRKNYWPGMSLEQRRAFLNMSFDDQLLFVIQFDYDVREVSEFAPNSLQTSVARVARQALKYAKDPACLVCRYERLVGSRGGGSDEEQLEELGRIASHIGRLLSSEELYDIAEQLYGDESNPFGKEGFANFISTFNKGKIGNWKNFFTYQHKKVFKEKLGKLLIDLGYEKDYNW